MLLVDMMPKIGELTETVRTPRTLNIEYQSMELVFAFYVSGKNIFKIKISGNFKFFQYKTIIKKVNY